MQAQTKPTQALESASQAAQDAQDVVLDIRGVSHAFGSNRVLYDINLKIVRGQIVSLVGPSGSGKSTLLRAILGTNLASQGQVLMDGVPVTRPGRKRGIVYQRYTLFPFMTALNNVAFGPTLDQSQPWQRVIHTPRFRRLRARVIAESTTLLEQVGLGHCLHQYPSELSGGMSQRVAIAQALAMRPGILLLDEPFGALDESMREDLQSMLLDLYQQNVRAKRGGKVPPYTIIIVTHELNEAIFVADRVIGLSQYWQYEAEGHSSSPGATIVYDAMCPVFEPDQECDFNTLRAQRMEIRAAVMEKLPLRPRYQYHRFWNELAQDKAEGIFRA